MSDKSHTEDPEDDDEATVIEILPTTTIPNDTEAYDTEDETLQSHDEDEATQLEHA